MKKTNILLSFILLLSIGAGYSQNLMINGDLESWTAGEPDGWVKFENIEQETNTIHGGTSAAKHISASSTKDFTQEVTGVQAGQEYNISYWYFDNDANARTRIWAYWLEGTTTLPDNEDVLRPSVYSEDDASWLQFNEVLVAPATADGFRFEVRVYNQDGNTGGAVYYDDFVFSGDIIIFDEPSNYPTDFNAMTDGANINLSWTDAVGAQLPQSYVIFIGTESDLPIPTDGIPEENDTDLSDGIGAINISYGIESIVINFLNENTTYYFSIYPYTNSGANIDFKNDGTAPSDNATTQTSPYLLEQPFDNGFGAWTIFSVTGPQEWTINESYGNPAPCGYMSGYESGSVENEDWLISPSFSLDNTTSEILTFQTATNYDGPVLELYISTDYIGSGDPNAASWDNLTFNLPEQGWDWFESGEIDLSGYSGSSVYIAYKYASTSEASSAYEIDEIFLEGEPMSIAENHFMKEINIYPNPSTGILNIINYNPFPVEISIYNIAGQMMYSELMDQDSQVFNLDDLTKGLYLVRFLNPENKNTATQKLIVQ